MSTQEAVMTTQDIANRLHDLCQENKYEQAQRELYSENAISIEPVQSPGMQSVSGLVNIIKKGEEFQQMIEEVHGGSLSAPLVAGNFISFSSTLDATLKGMGRQHLEEIAVYEVKDGKVVKEQFFY